MREAGTAASSSILLEVSFYITTLDCGVSVQLVLAGLICFLFVFHVSKFEFNMLQSSGVT
jgi:hypothetical protein